jgi:hypothetical protein
MHLRITSPQPRLIVLNRIFQIWAKRFPFCRANIFRYTTKVLDLKDEFWLRYENPIKSTRNCFLLIRKIFVNFLFDCFLHISPPVPDIVLKLSPHIHFDMENTTPIFNKIHIVNKYH